MKTKSKKCIIAIGQIASMALLLAVYADPFDCWYSSSHTCKEAVDDSWTCPDGTTAYVRCTEGPSIEYCTNFGLGTGSADCVDKGSMACSGIASSRDCDGTIRTGTCYLPIPPHKKGPGTAPCGG